MLLTFRTDCLIWLEHLLAFSVILVPSDYFTHNVRPVKRAQEILHSAVLHSQLYPRDVIFQNDHLFYCRHSEISEMLFHFNAEIKNWLLDLIFELFNCEIRFLPDTWANVVYSHINHEKYNFFNFWRKSIYCTRKYSESYLCS